METSQTTTPWSDAKIRRLVIPGLYCVGNNLYVNVSSPRSRQWIFRYWHAGRRHDMGLGSARLITLEEARNAAFNCRKLLAQGGDPLEQRRRVRQAARSALAKRTTFAECWAMFFASHREGWSEGHTRKWQTAITTYADPVFGMLAVDSIDTQMMLQVLTPIWSEKPAIANKLRGWVEAILDFAVARGWRAEGLNPAGWRHLKRLLADPTKIAPTEHHAALSWRAVPEFFAVLGADARIAARVLELIVLTCCRKREVLGMTWGELDLAQGVWSIPARRMKGRRPHRAALSTVAIELLHRRREQCGGHPLPSTHVFPSPRRGGRAMALSTPQALLSRLGYADRTTVHGFRSSFSEFATEVTVAASEVRELALAHAVGAGVVQAYMRADLFQRRRALADAWGNFCAGRPLDPAILIKEASVTAGIAKPA
jgi:integrase